MLRIPCPECELRLFLEDDDSTDRLTCPGLGTMFQWDKATRRATVFYEPAGQAAAEEPAVPPEERDRDGYETTGENLPPGETIANIARKWQDSLDEEKRRRKRRFTVP